MSTIQPQSLPDAILTQEEIDAVSGGMYKRPLQRPITVYYDDGISILTSDPASTNVRPQVT